MDTLTINWWDDNWIGRTDCWLAWNELGLNEVGKTDESARVQIANISMRGEAGGCANKRPLSFRFSAARQNAGIGVGLSTRNQLISRIKRRIIRTLDRLRERERAREREREKKKSS